MTIIFADAPPLRGIRQRVQQLAIRFAKRLRDAGGRVYYFDEPGNFVTLFLSPEKSVSNLWSWTRSIRTDDPDGIRHFIPPAGLPFGYHNEGINRWNHFWYGIALGSRFEKGDGPVVLIACNVLGLGWVGRLKEDFVIYDCADEISEFRQAGLNRKAVLAQEKKLIEKADAVVVTSQMLFESKSKIASRAVIIRNAAEIEHFNRALKSIERPKDIAYLKKPIVGFTGYLADWLDWPLIEAVVREGTEFDWVFIGPTTHNLSGLQALPNFHYLKKKPYEILPDYLANFSCAHIPFARTKLTLNVNPVKLYEYLASGLPVVATPIPEIEAFGDIVALADNPRDYLNAVRMSVGEDSHEKRCARAERAAGESWDARLDDYISLINELIGKTQE
ncbi:MAG: hypothetical protein ABIC40_06770 [bacterium]